MGTCIILAHVYFSQISRVSIIVTRVSHGYHVTIIQVYILYSCSQLTPLSAALLADGIVMHLIDYLKFDCPDNHGTFVTVEALGRYASHAALLYD